LNFYWHEFGADTTDAPLLLMLHGFLGSGADWEHVASLLQPPCRCYCPDLPGHGQTAMLDGATCAMEKTATLLLEDLDNLNVHACALSGYSMGGRLALYLATKYPERFQCLVLESASPGLQTQEERIHRSKHDALLARDLLQLENDGESFHAFLNNWYNQQIFCTLQQHPELLKTLVTRRLKNNPKGLAVSLIDMGTGAQPSIWETLAEVHVPALLLAGAEDHKFCLLGEKMANQMPQAALEILQDCSHNIHFEQPEKYATVLSAFFHAHLNNSN